MKNAVHFGAGNIGRGFIGAVLSKAGYRVQFVDVNEQIINELNEKNRYTVQIATQEQTSFEVSGVSGINSVADRDQLFEAISAASLITASVGPSILPFIAKDIAAGLSYAAEHGTISELNIVACENMIQATDFLRSEIDKHVSDEVRKLMDEKIGFPNSAVDRIVPIQHHEDPLTVQVEPFFEWVIEQTSWRGSLPEMEGVQFVEDLAPFIERKLLTVNAGHAAIAYLGLLQGFETIDQAMANPAIKSKVEKVLAETSEFLVSKYELDPSQHKSYVEKIIGRFENPYLSDECSRVGRAPIRKLGSRERLVYPASSLMEDSKTPDGLIETIAAALKFDQKNDPESQTLMQEIQEHGVGKAFANVSHLPESSPLVQAVVEQYNKE